MPLEKLRDISGSGYVAIPKGDLRKDGLVENDEIVEDQTVDVERVDERSYLVRFPDENGEVKELAESDVVQSQVAMEVLERLDEAPATPTAD